MRGEDTIYCGYNASLRQAIISPGRQTPVNYKYVIVIYEDQGHVSCGTSLTISQVLTSSPSVLEEHKFLNLNTKYFVNIFVFPFSQHENKKMIVFLSTYLIKYFKHKYSYNHNS